MESHDILLLEEGDPNSGFRTKNAPNEKARSVLVDEGNALVLRAALISVTHGDFTIGGDAATLLIFEFNYLSMKGSRRFTSGKIKLRFDNAKGDVKNRPIVDKIAPTGAFSINKTTSRRDIHQVLNAGINGEAIGIGPELGYLWETNVTKEKEHATRLAGVQRMLSEGSGRDDTVVWTLEEDPVRKQGIPSFLRSAVLLRRRADVPFYFTIDVTTGVDFEGRLRRLLGMDKRDPVDPVQVDGGTNLTELGIASLDPKAGDIDLENMKAIDIGKKADVIVATPLEVSG
ncbi:hypothetical protein K491DRAFT_713194 [Lophiostoma macrostomum CBS 122681]|uniref:Uncharacterized protein n=1 Tax=Lophiostoma macrostomum CBS 122681 TaxID=1314788 RepID=A0A6A6THX6_9PLEO|nr:hypothetical protein K491DRAFT_713194 [Lophiostoma macrostomum CBS 122681]